MVLKKIGQLKLTAETAAVFKIRELPTKANSAPSKCLSETRSLPVCFQEFKAEMIYQITLLKIALDDLNNL